MRKDNFETIISISGLSFLEQSQFYEKIVQAYSQIVKTLQAAAQNKFNVKIIDPVDGQHFPGTGTGISPNGKECNNCVSIDCRDCRTYKKEKEQENEQGIAE